ncbi:MAG: DNA replication/repair protein RecF [Vulcanimicrobiota bacterium]
MIVNKLELNNFRNLKPASLEFSPGFNLIIGKNAQGKSSFLEALYSLSLGRSYRTNKEENIINFDSSFARVAGSFAVGGLAFSLEIQWEKPESTRLNKTIKLNSNPVTRLSDFIARSPMVLFLAEDLEIIRGAPENRRKLLDLICSRLKPVYASTLREYNKILDLRNRWLKLPERNRDKYMGEIYSEKLISLGAEILCHRFQALESLRKIMTQIFIDLFKQDMPKLGYRSSVKEFKNREPESLKEAFSDALQRLEQSENKVGYTLAGPHRDDIVFKKDGKRIRNFGSLGEIRGVSVVLKLAEAEIISQQMDIEPVILIDDSLRELDPSRVDLFINFIKAKKQIFFAATEIPEFFKNHGSRTRLFNVSEGVISNATHVY